MISKTNFFPPIGASETIYSICSSLHHLLGHLSHRESSHLFFGDHSAVGRHLSPANLNHFCNFTENRAGNSEDILNNRTVIGLYRRFNPTKTINDLYKSPNSDKRPRLPKETDLSLRYCVHCVVEDREKIGRGAWRLEHQFSGVVVCPRHGIELKSTSFSPKSKDKRWIRVDELINDHPTIEEGKNDKKIHWLQHLAQVLWGFNQYENATPSSLRIALANHLANTGEIPSPSHFTAHYINRWYRSKGLPFIGSQFRAIQKFPLPSENSQLMLRWATYIAATACWDEIKLQLKNQPPFQAKFELPYLCREYAAEELLPVQVWAALNEGISLSRISLTTGFSVTSLNHALRSNPEVKNARKTLIDASNLHERRSWVRSKLAANPSWGRKELFRHGSKYVRWLELHDFEWLTAQLPHVDSGRWVQRPLFV